MDKRLEKLLRFLVELDQKAVKNRQEKGVVNKRVLKANTKKLKEIIKTYGWPTISLVGKDGAKNAWLLVQHSDDDLPFQKRCLRLISGIQRHNPREINSSQIAFLIDRIKVNEKKPQRFGTQFYTNKKGKFTYWPIRDIKNVDKRRALYGIEPLSIYVKAARSFNLVPIKKIIN